MDDVTNDTFLREKYTVMPEPDLSADRPAAGARRPNLLPPLKVYYIAGLWAQPLLVVLQGFDKDKAVKLAAPASVTAEKGFSKGCTKKSATKSEKIKECEKDLEPEETVMEDALVGLALVPLAVFLTGCISLGACPTAAVRQKPSCIGQLNQILT